MLFNCRIWTLVVICDVMMNYGISLANGQSHKCVPFYTDQPNATCWRQFSKGEMSDCSHKLCYRLSDGYERGCSSPWQKPTVHREHELQRIAQLARDKFVTQPSCTMRIKTNTNAKNNLIFLQDEENCTDFDEFILSSESCAIIYLNREISGYCIWYHNKCPKVQTDVTVCKTERIAEISTPSPEPDVSETSNQSLMGTEIIIIVAVFTNLVVLLVIGFIVCFLLKRSRMGSSRSGSNSPSKRPLPRVPPGDSEKVQSISKVDSLEFDKLNDESHYMYLSHDFVDIPRYYYIADNENVKNDVKSDWDYSYPDSETIKRLSIKEDIDTSVYMALVKHEDKVDVESVRQVNSGETEVKFDEADNTMSRDNKTENDNSKVQTDEYSGLQANGMNRLIRSLTSSDIEEDYSQLKSDYYVLEENEARVDVDELLVLEMCDEISEVHEKDNSDSEFVEIENEVGLNCKTSDRQLPIEQDSVSI